MTPNSAGLMGGVVVATAAVCVWGGHPATVLFAPILGIVGGLIWREVYRTLARPPAPDVAVGERRRPPPITPAASRGAAAPGAGANPFAPPTPSVDEVIDPDPPRRKLTTRASDGYFRVPNGDPMAQLMGDNPLVAPTAPPIRIEHATEYSRTEQSMGSEVWPPPMFPAAPAERVALSEDEAGPAGPPIKRG